MCRSEDLHRVLTCKFVVSLHVHYHLFMNFDFFHQVRSREFSSFFPRRTHPNPLARWILLCVVCCVIDKPQQNLREIYLKTMRFISMIGAASLCASPQTLRFVFSLCISFLSDRITFQVSLIKVPFISFLGCFIDMPYYFKLLLLLLLRSSHFVALNDVPLCSVVVLLCLCVSSSNISNEIN